MKEKIIRVILDTNVIISSFWGGQPKEIVQLWQKGEICVLLSKTILDEYFTVLNRFDLTDEDIEDLSLLFSDPRRTEIISPQVRLHIVKEDLDDNKFLESALEGNADYIISGDSHLLNLKLFQKIKILSPRDFLQEIS